MKEQKEAKRKEAESDTIFSTHVQSKDGVVALETDSKPRTVFLEEGEDDMASNIVIKDAHATKYDQVYIFRTHAWL
jgi:hypothetical protein